MLARLAPFIFVLLWSSSFVTGKTGLRFLSPLLFVAVRLAGCALVLVLLMVLLRRSWRPIAGRQGMHCVVAGVLLNGISLMSPHIGLALFRSLLP